jgi:hypothetical protein
MTDAQGVGQEGMTVARVRGLPGEGREGMTMGALS